MEDDQRMPFTQTDESKEDKQLLRRLRKHGSKGFVKVASAEGGIPANAAKNLIPAGS